MLDKFFDFQTDKLRYFNLLYFESTCETSGESSFFFCIVFGIVTDSPVKYCDNVNEVLN